MPTKREVQVLQRWNSVFTASSLGALRGSANLGHHVRHSVAVRVDM